MWHEILAAVLRCYGGATLPEEVVVTRPSRCDEAHDTLLVSERMDGLHIKICQGRKVWPPRGRTPATWQPRSPLAYSPMRWSCAGAMRGEDGERTSLPVTVW